MTAHRHKNRRIDAQLLTDRRPQAAPNGAAGLDGCKNVPGQVQLPDGLPVPVPCGGVVELGGGGDGVLRPRRAGEEVAQQVGGEEQLFSGGQGGIPFPLAAAAYPPSPELRRPPASAGRADRGC